VIISIDDVVKKLGVDRVAAEGLLKFLRGTDPPVAVFKGQRPSAKGKGAHVYDVQEDASQTVHVLLDKLMR